MNAKEAYQHCNKTGEDDFIFSKKGLFLRVVFYEPHDIGEVYVPAMKKRFLIQHFYDGWHAEPTRKIQEVAAKLSG